MTPELQTIAAPLSDALRRAGYTTAGIAEFLGDDSWRALRRGEPGAVTFALEQAPQTDLALLIRLFLLHEPVAAQQFETIVGSSLYLELIQAEVISRSAANDVDEVRAGIDLQPHVITGTEHIVFSDRDASMLYDHVPSPDHVLGVGAASMSLLNATPTSAVGSVLDLGTGSGVQALSQVSCAHQVVATDVHQRALFFAAATFQAANAAVEILHGPWFSPVAGRQFDRIVANPPFVVGPPEVSHVYRDSGLDLDGATRKVASESVNHLNPGGTAHLLGSWVHLTDQPWQARVASWLPDTGVSAWVLQRDVVDVAHYVGTWLKDESSDPRSATGKQKTIAWLQHFHQAKVRAVGFGFIAIKRIADDLPSEIVVEEIPQSIDTHFGAEVEEYFTRMHWLGQKTPEEILSSQFLLRPGVAKEVVSVADVDNQVGFVSVAYRLTRTNGLRWSHEVDEHVAAIVGGLHPQGLSLEETLEFYALAHDLNADNLQQGFVPIIIDLIRHGLVLPAELVAAVATDAHSSESVTE